MQVLNGNCHLSIGSYATLTREQLTLTLTGLVASVDGQHVLHEQETMSVSNQQELAKIIAKKLIEQGAKQYLF